MTASTTVFVSCEDYGDDIAHLQEQIDQNATTAESELAAKVAALQAQLSTLEAAQKSMTEQLAAAKAEVATAAANAAAAAQAAQAAADKAQGGADDAKAAAAAAQAAADKANQTLSEAVARVAVLEAKATSLQASIDELSAASKEASAKLAEIQALVNTLNASTTKNAADIAKLGEQVSALNAELGKVSTGLSARIDAIDKELNTIKTTYATKSELDAKAEVLANMDAQLKLQIESNLNYIKEMQAAIASLGEKDKELAAAIEKNYADVLAEIEELATSQAEALAALEAAVKAGDAKLDEAIKAVQAVAEANAAAIKDIQAALATKADKTAVEALAKDLAQAIADIAEVTADLAAHKTEVAKELADINAKIADLDEVVQGLVSQTLTNWNAIVANQEAIENLQIDVMDLISQLTKQVAGNWDAITKNQEAIFDINEDLTVLYDLVAQLTKQVTANWDQITKNMESIEDNKNDIADLDGIVSGLIKQVQANWDAIVANQEDIFDHEGRLNDIEEVMTYLIGQAQTNWNAIVANQEAIQDLKDLLAEYPALEKTVADLVTWTKAYDAKYDAFVKEQKAAIDAEIKKLTDKIENIDVLNASVGVLENQMDALLGRIQSVVFIPQYNDADGVVIAPVYAYQNGTKYTTEKHNVRLDVEPQVELKFRVKPAADAKELAKLYTDGKAKVELYVESKLQTRALDNVAEVKSVKADAEEGVIVVTAKFDDEKLTANGYYPTALVIGSTLYDAKEATDDVVLDITTEYFNAKAIGFDTYLSNAVIKPVQGVKVNGAGQYEIPYTDINVSHNPINEVYAAINNIAINVTNWNYSTSLKVFAGKNGSGVWCKVSDNTNAGKKWSDFTAYAKNQGFVFNGTTFVTNKTNSSAAIVNNVGKTITLKLADETFGYDNAGEPNKSYEITYIITKPVAERSYNFGSWANEWNLTNGSQAFAVSSTGANKFSNGSLNIEKYMIQNVVAADEATLAAELNNQISLGNVTYKINNAPATGVALTVNPSTKKADLTVNFPAGTKYETKNIVAVVSTIYGDITFTAKVELTYPTDFLAHEVRFTDGRTGDFIIEAGNQVAVANGVPAYRDGLVGSSLPAAYTNYVKYTAAPNVVYTFTQKQETYTHPQSGIKYTPNKVSIATEHGSNAYMKLTGTPSIPTILLDATEYVKYEVVVTIDGHEVTRETVGVNVLYPLHGMEVTSGVQTIQPTQLANSQTVSVIGNVSLKDRYGNELFKNGQAVAAAPELVALTLPTNASVWGITGLTYSLEEALASDGQAVSTVSVSSNGEVGIVDPNISRDITVTVKVQTVGYYYTQLVGYFDVIIKATH